MYIRVWQVNLDRDKNKRAFMGFDKKHKIDFASYDCVYDDYVEQTDLEHIYSYFNLGMPKFIWYKGRSMSVSDLVEIVDDKDMSNIFFCDNIGFTRLQKDDIDFTGVEHIKERIK